MDQQAVSVEATLPDEGGEWELRVNERRTDARLTVRTGGLLGYITHVEIPARDVDYSDLLEKCVEEHKRLYKQRFGHPVVK